MPWVSLMSAAHCVVLDRVDGEADHLDAALVEFGFDLGDVAEFGGADRREVLGMREQHHPVIADPFVEIDFAFRGLRFEIRRDIIDRKRHSKYVTEPVDDRKEPNCRLQE